MGARLLGVAFGVVAWVILAVPTRFSDYGMGWVDAFFATSPLAIILGLFGWLVTSNERLRADR